MYILVSFFGGDRWCFC